MTTGIFNTIITTLYELGTTEQDPKYILELLSSENKEDSELVRAVTKVCLSSNCIDMIDIKRITRVVNDDKHLHAVICELDDGIVSQLRFDNGTPFISVGRININGTMYTVIFTESLSNVIKHNNCNHFRILINIMITDYHKYLHDATSAYVEEYLMIHTDDITLSCLEYGLFYSSIVLCEHLGMDTSKDKVACTDTSKLFMEYIKENNVYDNFVWTSLFDDDTFCVLITDPKYKALLFNDIDDEEDDDNEFDDEE